MTPATRGVEAIGADNPDMRAVLCGSQIIGLGIIRHVMLLEPLACQPRHPRRGGGAHPVAIQL
jgi:hypothetical protein